MMSGARSVDTPLAPGVLFTTICELGDVALELVLRPSTPVGGLTAFSVVSGFSTDAASQTLPPLNFCVKRALHWRVQTEPTTYCASMVAGIHSVRGAIPARLSVTRVQVCPATKEKPPSR